MRLFGDRYQCVLCGKVLDVPAEQKPLAVMTADIDEPDMRTIRVGGVEIHRCLFEQSEPN
jgi:hypothetical protein